MPRYTVKNAEGREVTFDWHGQGDPTDADMEEVFAAAGSAQPDAKLGPAEGKKRPSLSASSTAILATAQD
jgi:hypothetical protein